MLQMHFQLSVQMPLKCSYAHTLPVKFASAYAENARTQSWQGMENVSWEKKLLKG